MFERYGPNGHARTRGGRRYQPQFLLPEASWWREQAQDPARRVSDDPDPFNTLCNRVVEFLEGNVKYFGMPVAACLPVSSSRHLAGILLFSAITMMASEDL